MTGKGPSKLTRWFRSKFRGFKGEDASSAIGTCLRVLGIATDNVADIWSSISASWLRSLRKFGRIGQERSQGHPNGRQATLNAVDLRRYAAVVERGRLPAFKSCQKDTKSRVYTQVLLTQVCLSARLNSRGGAVSILKIKLLLLR